jgi:acetyltransferase-like isoleucine patch superfamily enzyme
MNRLLSGSFLTAKELLKLNFKSIGKNVLIDRTVLIPNPLNIKIGNNVRIDCNSILSASNNSEIILRNNVHLGPFSLLYGADNHKIIFDNHSALAAGCKLYGRTENYDGRFLMNPTHNDEDIELITGDIILKKYATLGCDSVLFPNSIIPEGTVLGTKSLHTGKSELEPWSIYAGTPIKFFRKRHRDCELLAEKYKNIDEYEYSLEDTKYIYCNNKLP